MKTKSGLQTFDFSEKILFKTIAKWIIYGVVLCLSYRTGYNLAVFTQGAGGETTRTYLAKVVIDPGHGGVDPGKVASDGTAEKDINLQIAARLKRYLEAADVEVYMTRESDTGLYGEKDEAKKGKDLRNRVAFIEKVQPDLTISIHQNSYPSETVKGAQLFYYEDSGSGKRLSEFLQDELKTIDPAHDRPIKSNDSYYLLKKTGGTIVIAECGFLSNPEEAAKLEKAEYQDRLAYKLHMGILRYLNSR